MEPREVGVVGVAQISDAREQRIIGSTSHTSPTVGADAIHPENKMEALRARS